jgi:predicted nuclease of predicted toxin-antitoxin system
VKFLIDECLSPELAELARARGFTESMHVTRLGLTSAKDWTITRRAVDDGFILMTNNTADFTALYGREELHVGLVCLNAAPGTMSLDLQKRLFLLALAELEEIEPYNEVLEITASAKGEITVDRYDLPGAVH